jgi:hypothetical protein
LGTNPGLSFFLAGQQALYYGGAELPEALKALRRSPSGRTSTEDLEIGLITPCGERIARFAAPRDFIRVNIDPVR